MADVVQYRFRLRRGLAADWTSKNEVLLGGEFGLETDTGKLKIGDGTKAWVDLAYFAGGSSGVVDIFSGVGIAVDKTDPTKPVISSSLAAVALSGRVSSYSALPTSLGTADAGKAYLNDGDGLIYVWNGSAFQSSGSGYSGGGGGSSKVPAVRASNIQSYTSGPNNLPIPATAQVGDLAIVFVGGFYPADPITGWVTAAPTTGSYWSGTVFLKELDANDLATGYVTVNTTTPNPMVAGIAVMVGSKFSFAANTTGQQHTGGATSSSLTLPLFLTNNTLAVCFNSNRGASDNSVVGGTVVSTVNATDRSGSISTLALSGLPQTIDFNYSVAGTGYYQAAVLLNA